MRIAVPPTVVLATDVFDRFLDDNDLRGLPSSATTTRRSCGASWPRRCPLDVVDNLLALPSGSPLPAGGALVEPARGLAVPAVRRRLRHLHAAERSARTSGRAAGAPAGGDQARVRLHFQPARQGLRQGHALPAGRGEDGGHRPEAGRQPARPPLLPDFAGVARSHNFYPVPPMRVEDGVAAVALGLGTTVVDGGTVPPLLPALPAASAAVLVGEDGARNSQRQFYALQLGSPRPNWTGGDARGAASASTRPKPTARWTWGRSTYSLENDAIYDGLSGRACAS